LDRYQLLLATAPSLDCDAGSLSLDDPPTRTS
jgi:hypothetical protein